MSKHILIPLDGSLLARQVLPFLATIFSAQRVKLSFLRVLETNLEPVPATYKLNDWTGLMKRLAKSETPEAHPIYKCHIWQGFKDELKVKLEPNLQLICDAGFSVDLVLRFGDPVKEIQTHIVESNVDLVAMMSKSKTGLSRALFGSVAEALVRTVKVPVLIIKPESVLTSLSETTALA